MSGIAQLQLVERLTRLTAAASRKPSAVEAHVSGMFDEWRAPLLRYTLSLGLPVQDGEDIVQEVFLNLFRHLSDGKPQDNLRGWVFRVGHNLALKRRMANGRTALDDAAELSVIDPAPNPEEHAAQQKTHQRLLAVVAALPERDRNCLILRAEGLRYREIAEALEMSLGAVAGSLAKSLSRLSETYQR